MIALRSIPSLANLSASELNLLFKWATLRFGSTRMDCTRVETSNKDDVLRRQDLISWEESDAISREISFRPFWIILLIINSNADSSVWKGFEEVHGPEKMNVTCAFLSRMKPPIPALIFPSWSCFQAPSIQPIKSYTLNHLEKIDCRPSILLLLYACLGFMHQRSAHLTVVNSFAELQCQARALINLTRVLSSVISPEKILLFLASQIEKNNNYELEFKQILLAGNFRKNLTWLFRNLN